MRFQAPSPGPAAATTAPGRALQLLLVSALTAPAHAHDPGFSSARVVLEANAVVVDLVFSKRDLVLRSPGPRSGVGQGAEGPPASAYSGLSNGGVSLRGSRGPVPARSVEVAGPAAEEGTVKLIFPRPAGTLTLDFPVLARLDRGHRLLVSVHERPPALLERRLLHRGKTSVTLAAADTPGVWSALTRFCTLPVDAIKSRLRSLLRRGGSVGAAGPGFP